MDSTTNVPTKKILMSKLELFVLYQCGWMETFKLMVQENKDVASTNSDIMDAANCDLVDQEFNITTLESYINGTYAMLKQLNSMVQKTKCHENRSNIPTHPNAECNINPSGESFAQAQHIETSAEIRSSQNTTNLSNRRSNYFGTLNNELVTTTQLTTNAERANTLNGNGSDQMNDNQCTWIREVNVEQAVDNVFDTKNFHFEINELSSDVLHLNDNVNQGNQSMPLALDAADDDKTIAKTDLKSKKVANTRRTLFSCDICSKSFHSKALKTKHTKAVHKGQEKHEHICYVCNKRFPKSETLRNHYLANHRPAKTLSCKNCGKVFTRSYNLNRHLKIHTGEKQYSCETCGKKFTRSDTWRDHLRIHHKDV